MKSIKPQSILVAGSCFWAHVRAVSSSSTARIRRPTGTGSAVRDWTTPVMLRRNAAETPLLSIHKAGLLRIWNKIPFGASLRSNDPFRGIFTAWSASTTDSCSHWLTVRKKVSRIWSPNAAGYLAPHVSQLGWNFTKITFTHTSRDRRFDIS